MNGCPWTARQSKPGYRKAGCTLCPKDDERIVKDIELDQTTCSQRASTCLALKIDPGFSAPQPDLWHNAHGKLNIRRCRSFWRHLAPRRQACAIVLRRVNGSVFWLSAKQPKGLAHKKPQPVGRESGWGHKHWREGVQYL